MSECFYYTLNPNSPYQNAIQKQILNEYKLKLNLKKFTFCFNFYLRAVLFLISLTVKQLGTLIQCFTLTVFFLHRNTSILTTLLCNDNHFEHLFKQNCVGKVIHDVTK